MAQHEVYRFFLGKLQRGIHRLDFAQVQTRTGLFVHEQGIPEEVERPGVHRWKRR